MRRRTTHISKAIAKTHKFVSFFLCKNWARNSKAQTRMHLFDHPDQNVDRDLGSSITSLEPIMNFCSISSKSYPEGQRFILFRDRHGRILSPKSLLTSPGLN